MQDGDPLSADVALLMESVDLNVSHLRFLLDELIVALLMESVD